MPYNKAEKYSIGLCLSLLTVFTSITVWENTHAFLF